MEEYPCQEPQAPRGATAAMFEQDLTLVGSVHGDETARAKVWELLPTGAVLGSLFRRSHIYYLFVITHLKRNFWISLIIPQELF